MRYLIPKALNTVTGTSVKEQNLYGTRFQLHQRALCQRAADAMAEKMSTRTKQEWKGYVEEYEARERIFR